MTPEQPPAPPPPPPVETDRVPFWGYADLFLVAGLALPSMFFGFGVVRLFLKVFHLHGVPEAAQAIPEMLIGYALLFSLIMVIFRVQYGRPFWSSLGWTRTRLPLVGCVLWGFGTSMGVAMVGLLIRTPPLTGPLVEMMKGRGALILLAIFGTTAAPLFEELAFRGFLQPLLVRSLGTLVGICLTAALFGALHYSEYGNSWRSALMVALSGVSFGCLRHFTGSTKASTIAHAAFNALPFLTLFAQGKHAGF